MKLIWTCELDETGLIRQNAEVVNTGEGQLEVGKIELAFTVPADANEILTTTGHHLRERSPQRQDFTLGRFAKASMAGRPDFDATLLLSVGEKASASRTATSTPHTWHGAATACSPRNVCPTPAV